MSLRVAGLTVTPDVISQADCLLAQQVMRSLWRAPFDNESSLTGQSATPFLEAQIAELGKALPLYPALGGLEARLADAAGQPLSHLGPVVGLRFPQGRFTRQRHVPSGSEHGVVIDPRVEQPGDVRQDADGPRPIRHVFVVLATGAQDALVFPYIGAHLALERCSAVVIDVWDDEGLPLLRLATDVVMGEGCIALACTAYDAQVQRDGGGEPLLSPDWVEWIEHNQQRGCSPYSMLLAMVHAGLSFSDSARQLGFTPQWPGALAMSDALYIGRAGAEIYEVDGLLDRDECDAFIGWIDEHAAASTVVSGAERVVDYEHRGGDTAVCRRERASGTFIDEIEHRIALRMQIPVAFSEELQGHRYDAGDFFRPHFDAFEPGTREFDGHAGARGQRTWTVLVFLNDSFSGGDTRFPELGLSVRPRVGKALVWNNLDEYGQPARALLHEGCPVLQGRKYVLTKWFRARPQQVWTDHPLRLSTRDENS